METDGIDMKKKVVFIIAIILEVAYLAYGVISILKVPDCGLSFTSRDIQVAEEDNRLFASSPQMALDDRGIYGATVYLEPHESPFTIHTSSSSQDMIGAGDIHSDGPDTVIDYDIYAMTPMEVSIEILFEDKESVLINPIRKIDVYFQRGHTLAVMLGAGLFWFVLIDLLLFFALFRREDVKCFIDKHGVFLTVFIATMLVCSIPLMTRGILDGDDKEFHLMRIQGLADGLRSGYFPVKLQPGWYNGFTYPVGVYYGQIMLYPSALLRMLGFPLGLAYKIYVVIMNLLTFGITYYSSKKITRDQNISLGITIFYMLSLYRLVNIYKRYAAGEAQAMTFLPLFILGMAALYDRLEAEDKNAWIYLTVATTGIINSHTITTFLTALMCLVFVLMNVKKTFMRSTLIQYGKFLGVTVLLNLFYLVPFFDYLLNFSKKVDSQMGKDMAAKAAYLPQIFSQAYSVTGHNGNYTANGDMPLSIGVSAILILIACLILLVKGSHDKQYKNMRSVLILFLISVIMCTAIFPYNYLELYANSFYRILQKIQYPWRFLSVATVLIFCIFLITILKIGKEYGRKAMWVYMSIILLVTFWQSTELMNRIVNENPSFDTYSIINPHWVEAEYLPSNTDLEELGYTDVLTSDPGIKTEGMERNGIDITIDVENNTADIGYVQLPLLCYPYYRTEDGQGNVLETIPGDYRKLCFAVPAGFNGRVHTFFKEPLSWRFSETISLITLIILVLNAIRSRRMGMRSESNAKICNK